MSFLLTVLILIVMLGILISTHELGHLVMAKTFNVYCLEYSIGFGPKLFSRRRKGGETAFSLRAFPLGGYVSMYGEGVELPDGVSVPESRSLNGVSAWKRALILVAGIAVNLLLALLFTFVYATCFPTYYTASYFDTGYDAQGQVLAEASEAGSRAYCFWIKGTIGTYAVDESTDRLYSPSYEVNSDETEGGYIVDCAATVDGNSYVALYEVESTVNDTDLLSGLTFYKPLAGFYPSAIETKLGLMAKPDFATSAYPLSASSTLTLHLDVLATASRDSKPTREDYASFLDENRNVKTLTTAAALNGSAYAWNGSENLVTTTYTYWAPFGARLLKGCQDFAYFFQSIGLGLASIFTGNLSNLGSVVAMGSAINQATAFIGAGQTFFLYGGFLSLNLAIFNLLPFPGLDGWQLFVTFVEKVFRKKIPEKIKNAVSFIGLALLFGLSIFLIVKDIVTLVK
jgi:membrane-associated protease RseP (regulator of RpoE activity)